MVRLRIPVWSRLTRIQRILLGAVALVVVLFIVSVGIGGRTGEANLSQPPGFITWLGDLFGGPPQVDRADLTGDCVPGAGLPPDGRLTINSFCVLHVKAGDTDLRQVKLRADNPLSVEAPAPRGDATAVKNLAAHEDVTVSVNADGADITVTCAAAGSCVVVVG